MMNADRLHTPLTPARSLATVSVKDRLSKANRKDFFTFTLTNRSSFNASLNGINRKANVDLLLRDASGRVIGASKNKRNLSESIRQVLAAGSYTLQTTLKGKTNTRYQLTASSQLTPSRSPVIGTTPSPIAAIDLAGNSLGSARSIGLSGVPSTFTDVVSNADPDDYYVFTVGDASNPSGRIDLNFTKTGQDTGATINLRDQLGNVIKSETLYSSDGGTNFSKTVAAGTYYLQINSDRITPTPYSLTLATTPIPDTAGNLLGSARPLSLTATPTPITEFVGAGDRQDFYRITVGSAGAPTERFAAELKGINGNLLEDAVRIALRDSLGNLITSESVYSGGGGASIGRNLATGTYYLEVNTIYDSADQANYTLNLSSTPIPDLAGNSRPTARSLTPSSTPSTVSDFVGIGDGEDYYKFTLFTNQTLNITLGGVGGASTTASLLYGLEDALGNSIGGTSGFAAAGGGATFSKALTGSVSGTDYYFRVSSSSSFSEGTGYGVTVSVV